MNKEKDTSVDFALQGTGMDVLAQMKMIRETIAENPEISIWKSKIAEKNTTDLAKLYWEYLVQSDILPFELAMYDDRVICPTYDNQALPDIVSSNEREGTIRKSIELIEELLVNGEDGDTHVLISPPGWSGLGHDHPDTQIYYYQRIGSEIRSMTFISRSGDLVRSEKIREVLTGQKPNDTKTEKEKILEFTSSVHSFRFLEPHDVVHVLEEASGENLPHVYKLVENFPEISADVMNSIYELENFTRNEITDASRETLSRLERKIGQTVLDMQYIVTYGRKPQSATEYLQAHIIFSEHDGCNGGGTIYERGLNSEGGKEEFLNWGICAMNKLGACISPNRGKKERVGRCMICPACHEAFNSGKTLEEIKAMAKPEVTQGEDPIEVPEGSIFAVAAMAFVSAIFSKN